MKLVSWLTDIQLENVSVKNFAPNYMLASTGIIYHLDRVKRIWYLSPMRAVIQEELSDRKQDPWLLWMAGHAQLKFVMTECSKTQIRLTGLT